MRSPRPILAYVLVERLYNRRITVRRDEAEGGYRLQLETCLSREAAAEYAEELGPAVPFGKHVELVRGRILVTRLALSNEAMQAIFGLFQHHEHSATQRQKARNRRQQSIIARLAALEDAAITADLQRQPAEPAQAPSKPPRKPRTPKE
ncbi:hypothetical protein Q5H93_21630 [Hymenobacter sp. ASUV-10]|uniref:Uncharacterized protein n=1 Tax=Hymenobacter aranciens TaxID=3063996 RepID=A0ABT9BL21_9BACT|nr:hypothetical protein [Hymenobacter sp. ASUV-10]MDO7877361.1 hypothetical protein [Hymenobacter sp. ASUV-10]